MNNNKNTDSTESAYRHSKKTILTIAIGAAAALCGIFIIAGVLINNYVVDSGEPYIIGEDEAAALDADCILVLGTSAYPDGTPSPMLQDRLDTGLHLYALGASPVILMSGDYTNDKYNEVGAMCDYAYAFGIASRNVYADCAGLSTYESILRARDVFGAKKIIIVTQQYHLYRALYIARALGLEAYGVETANISYSSSNLRRTREFFAQVKDYICVSWQAPATYPDIPIDNTVESIKERIAAE